MTHHSGDTSADSLVLAIKECHALCSEGRHKAVTDMAIALEQGIPLIPAEVWTLPKACTGLRNGS